MQLPHHTDHNAPFNILILFHFLPLRVCSLILPWEAGSLCSRFLADHPATTGASGGEAEAAGGEGCRCGEGSTRRSRYHLASSVRMPVLKERAYLPHRGEPVGHHHSWNSAPSLPGFSEILATPRSSAYLMSEQPIPQLAVAMRNDIPGPVTCQWQALGFLFLSLLLLLPPYHFL